MPKRRKKDVRIDYLAMFKQSLAMSFMVFLFGGQESYAASEIIANPDSGIGTVVGTNGNVIDITGGHKDTSSGTGFHHFSKFHLDSGDIAKLWFASGMSKYVNFVDSKVNIQGIFNAMKDQNTIGGNVVFVSPQGMVVGPAGVLNVGSLQLMTPTTSSYDQVVGLGSGLRNSDLSKLVAGASTEGSVFEGKIYSAGSVNLADGHSVTLGLDSDIVAGFSANGFATTQSGGLPVKADGLIDSTLMTGSNGNIVIESTKITSTDTSDIGGLLQATGDITLSAPYDDSTSSITTTSRIHSDNKIFMGDVDATGNAATNRVTVKNDVSAGGEIVLNASSLAIDEGISIKGDKVALNAIKSNLIKGNVEANKGIVVSSKNSANLSEYATLKNTGVGDIDIDSVTFEQGEDSVILHSGTGKIDILSPMFEQSNSAQINHTGTGDVKITAFATNKLNSVSAQGGSVEVNATKLSLNDTVTAKNDITINVSEVELNDYDKTIFNAGGHLNITAENDLGVSSSEKLKVSAGALSVDLGELGGDAYIDLVGDKNTDIKTAKNIKNMDLDSDGSLTISGNIKTSRTIDITAAKGIEQKSGSEISATRGGVSLKNTTSGAVKVNEITAKNGGAISVKNQGGVVEIGGTLSSADVVNVEAQDGIIQTTSSAIKATNNVAIKNNGTGNITTNKITSENGTVSVTNAGGNVTLMDLLTSSGKIDITAKNIKQESNDVTLAAKGDITLVSTDGDVGAEDSHIIVSTNKGSNVVVDAAQSANITGDNTDIDLSNISSNKHINLATLGDGSVLIGGDFHNENGDIGIRTEKALNVTNDITAAGKIVLESKNGIVQTDGTIIEAGIGDTQPGSISIINSGDNGVFVTDVKSNNSAVIIDNLTNEETGNITVGNVTAVNGPISINNTATTGDVIIDGKLTGDIEIRIAAKNDIVATENAGIIESTGDMILTATNGSIGSNESNLNIKAVDTVTATAGKNIYLDSQGSDIKLGAVTAGEMVNIKTSDLGVDTNKSIVLTDLIQSKKINLTAQGSILQETTDKSALTLDGSERIELTAVNDDIGDTTNVDDVKSVVLKTPNVLIAKANATTGSVAITGVDTSVSTGSVTAGKNLDITTTGDGYIVVANTTNNNYSGYVNLSSDKNVIFDSSISAAGNVNINADNVTQNLDSNTTAVSSGADISIKATNVGTDSKSLLVDAMGKVSVGTEDNHASNVYLQDINGEMTIGQLYADTNLVLKAQADILKAENGSINSVGNVTLESVTGNIGGNNTDSAIELNITGENALFNVKNAENVNVKSTENALSTGNIKATGDVEINTVQDLHLKGVIDAQTAKLTAEGNITQSKGLADDLSIKAEKIDLTSTGGNIGTPKSGEDSAVAIGISLKTPTQADFGINANADKSVVLKGINTDLSTQDVSATENIDLSTTGTGNLTVEGPMSANGYISLDSAKDLTIGNTIEAGDFVNLKSANNLTVNNTIEAGNYVNAESSGNMSIGNTITAQTGYVNLDSSGTLTTNGTITSGSYTKAESDGAMSINGAVNATGYVELTSGNELTTNTITSGEYVKAESSGSMTLGENVIADTSITLDANGGIIQTTGKTLTSGTDITVTNKAGGKISIDNATSATGNIVVTNNEATTAQDSTVTVGKLTATDGTVEITNAVDGNDVVLGGLVQSAKDITIDTKGSISQTHLGKALQATEDIVLKSDTGIGSVSNSIQLSSGGKVTAEVRETVPVPNGIYLTSVDSSLTTGVVNSNGGDVSIIATGNDSNITMTDKVQGNNVNLDAGHSVVQSLENAELDRSIEATGDLSLTAQKGNLGVSGESIDFSADGTLEANASNGSVFLNGIGTDIVTESIQAKTDIDLSTQIDANTGESGEIIVSKAIETTDGYIRLDSSENLVIEHNLSAGKHIVLNANRGIEQSNGVQIVAGTNAITADGEGYVSIQNSNGGDILVHNATAQKGDITITNSVPVPETELSGDIKVGNLTADTGSVSVYNNIFGNIELDSVITSKNGVELSTNGNILQTASNTGLAIDTQGNVDLTAVGGSVAGANSNHLKINVDGLVKVDANNVLLDSVNKDLNVLGISNNGADSETVSLKTTGSGNVDLQGLVKGGNITIDSASAITQSDSLDKSIEASSNLKLLASSNIGTVGHEIDFSSNGTVTAGSGSSIAINSVDSDVNIGMINAGGNVDVTTSNIDRADVGNITIEDSIYATSGYVNIDATKSVNANGTIQSGAQIVLNSQDGNVSLGDAVSSGTYVDINSSKGVTIDGSVDAGSYVTLNANDGNIDIDADLNAGSYVDIVANGDISQNSGLIQASGSNSGVGANIVSDGGSVTIKNLKTTAGAVNVEANKVGSGATVKSGHVSIGGVNSADKITISTEGIAKNVAITNTLETTDQDIVITTKQGNIYQNGLDYTALKTSTGNVVLDAVGKVGTSDNKALSLNVGGTVEANGSGVYLKGENNLNIAGINKDNGTTTGIVNITTESGNVNIQGLVNGETVTIDSAENIIQNSALSTAIKGKNITLNSDIDGIGVDGNAIDIELVDGGIVNAESLAGDVYLNSSDGSLSLGTVKAIGHKVDVDSATSLNLNGLVDAKVVDLYAVNDITQANDLTDDLAIKAEKIDLTSASGNIGTPKYGENQSVAIGISLKESALADKGIKANADKSVVLKGVNTSITTNDVSAGKSIDLSTTGEGKGITISGALDVADGYISLDSAADLTVDKTIKASDFVKVSGKDVYLNELITAGTNIIVESDGSISQGSAITSAVLNAGTGIDITAGGNIGLSSKSILLNAGGVVTAEGQNIFISSPNQKLTLGNVTGILNGSVINIGATDVNHGDVVLSGLVKGGTVTIEAQKGIAKFGNDQLIDVTGKLTLDARDGDIGTIANSGAEPPVPANPIGFKAGVLEAHADKGSIVLNGIDSDITINGNVSARDNFDLRTSGSGDINVESKLETTNGYISLNSADDININNEVESGSYVNLVSAGSLTTDGTITSGGEVLVQSVGDMSINKAIDATGNVTLDSGRVLTTDGIITSDGNVNIESATNMTIGNAINANSYVRLDSSGILTTNGVITSGSYVNAESDGNMIIGNTIESNSHVNLNSSGSLTMNGSVVSNSSYVDISSVNNLDINSEIKTFDSENGKVTISTTSGDINLNNGGNVQSASDLLVTSGKNIVQNASGIVLNADGNIDIEASNNVGENGEGQAVLVNAGKTTNILSAQNAFLKDNSDFTIGSANVTGNLHLTATGNILQGEGEGITAQFANLISENASIGSDTNAIKLNAVGKVDATAENGSVYLTGSAINVGDILADSVAQITSSDSINLKGVIDAQTAKLTAEGNITQLDTLENGLSIKAEKIDLTSTGGNIGTPKSGEDSAVAIGISLKTPTQADFGINANADKSVVLKGINTDLSTQDVSATENIDLSTTGTGNLTVEGPMSANGYISLDSAKDLTIGNTIEAGDFVNLKSANNLTVNNTIKAGNYVNAESSANMSIGNTITAQTGHVNLDSSGTLTTNGTITSGSYTKAESDGAMSINGALNATGYVELTSGNELTTNAITSGGYVNLDSTDNMLIGQAIDATGNVALNSTNALTTQGTIDSDGNVNLESAADMHIGNNITAEGYVDINSEGSLTTNGTITSGSYTKAESSGTMSINGAIDSTEYVELTSGSSLTTNAITSGGYVNLDSTDNMLIGQAIDATGNVALNSANALTTQGTIDSDGNVNLESAANMHIGNNITAEGYVDINSEGSLTTNTITSGEYVKAESSGSMTIGENVIADTSITLDANGGIIQTTGKTLTSGTDITVTNKAGGKISIDNATSATGNIVVTNNEATTAQDSTVTVGKLTATDGTVEITNAVDGNDVILNSIIMANGITINSEQNIFASESNTDVVLDSTAGINLTVGKNIGLSSLKPLLLNATGFVNLNKGEKAYIKSDVGNLAMGNVAITDDLWLKTDSGSVSLTEDINTDFVEINSAKDITVSADINSDSGVSLEAGKEIMQDATSTIKASADDATVSIIAKDGNLILNGDVNSENGSVVIKNTDVDGSYSTTINSLNAGANFEVLHKSNGLLSINGDLTNNGNSSIKATNSGSASGITIQGNIDNNGDISIESDGLQGLNIVGNINNTIASGSDITINNNAGSLNLSSGAIQNGNGNNITVTNSGDGVLDIGSEIINNGTLTVKNLGNSGVNIGSTVTPNNIINNGTIDITNNGDDGLNINSEITNTGSIIAINTAGGLSMDGVLVSEKGSTNKFVQSGSGDLNINSEITAKGADLKFENSGSGKTVLAQDAYITVYSILDNGAMYTGNLNILNSGNAGNIQIDGKISGLALYNSLPTQEGLINISNTSTNIASSIIFGANVDAQNNKFIVNNEANGGIRWADGLTFSSNKELSITNKGAGGLDLGDSTTITASSVKITNTTGGIDIGANSSYSATSGDLNIDNSGDDSVLIGDSTTISGANVVIKNTGNGRLFLGNETDINATSQSVKIENLGDGAFNLGSASRLNAGTDLTVTNLGSAGINIDTNTTLSAGNKVDITNNGSDGIVVDGVVSGKDVKITNNNSDVMLGHNQVAGNIVAENSLEVTVTGGDITNNSGTEQTTNNSLVSVGTMKLTANNIGGFDADSDKSLHINSTGLLTVGAQGDVNIHSANKALNIDSLSAKDVLLTTLNASINAGTVITDNLYLAAKGKNASIDVQSLTNSGFLSTESDLDTKIISISSTDLNVDSMLSNTGSIYLGALGNVHINEIAAANDITAVVEGEKLSINNLGKVEKAPDVVPKTVNLTVKDANASGGVQYKPGMSYTEIQNVKPQSKLDIYNGYVQDKVTLKADVINAGVYDITEESVPGQKRVDTNGVEATGFHNANQNGKLLEFDIQGANVPQEEIVTDPLNEYYVPDPNDTRAHIVYVTINDSVNGAEYGANFKKLYADYAFVDAMSANSDAAADVVIESAIIKEAGIIRNNKNRIDINNHDKHQNFPINKHYNDEPNVVLKDQPGFNAIIGEDIQVDVKPPAPVEPELPLSPDYLEENNPQKIVKIPTYESITEKLVAHDDMNATTDEAVNVEELNDGEENAPDSSHLWKNIRWVVKKDERVIGSSDNLAVSSIKSLVKITKNSIVLKTRREAKENFQKGENIFVSMSQNKKSFETVGKVNSVKGNFVEIRFNKLDKAAQNLLLLWCMERENL